LLGVPIDKIKFNLSGLQLQWLLCESGAFISFWNECSQFAISELVEKL
jgi:hypothetical protein